jgi:hypothetical protein
VLGLRDPTHPTHRARVRVMMVFDLIAARRKVHG